MSIRDENNFAALYHLLDDMYVAMDEVLSIEIKTDTAPYSYRGIYLQLEKIYRTLVQQIGATAVELGVDQGFNSRGLVAQLRRIKDLLESEGILAPAEPANLEDNNQRTLDWYLGALDLMVLEAV